MTVFFFEARAWVLSLVVSVVLLAVVWIYYRDMSYRATPQWIYLTLTILAGLSWMSVLINLVIEILLLIKTLTGLPELVLGMTIMAVGNSLSGTLSRTRLHRRPCTRSARLPAHGDHRRVLGADVQLPVRLQSLLHHQVRQVVPAHQTGLDQLLALGRRREAAEREADDGRAGHRRPL